jgi:release factor glutamine methyltransferase
MQIDRWLRSVEETLQGADVSTARLDALVLLEDYLGKDRALILAHPELELTIEQIATLNEQISKRALHTPLAYIRGKTEFFGREFIINDFVLEPRPESETIIELVKKLPDITKCTIIDVGTGSGALAITTKLELPSTTVMAIDIDPNCLELTRKNAEALQADIAISLGNLLDPIATSPPQLYVLLCNLPYVPESFHINQAATHEPRLAIFGGRDGLELYRTLFSQIETLPIKPHYILAESMPPQHEELSETAESHSYTQLQDEDFIQVFELTDATKTSSVTTK